MIKAYQGNIYPWHCDQMGHMNVKFYTEKFDQANFQLFALVGMNWKYFKESDFGMAAVEQNTSYLKEVYPGENIYIESAIVELKEKVMVNKHVMKKSDTEAVAAESQIVCVHFDRKLRQSESFPDFVSKNHKSLFP